jgi:signal transduction histidine kinase
MRDASADGSAHASADGNAHASADGGAAGDGRAPQPSLSRLRDLVERARGAGMAVDVVAHGTARPLPLTVDLAAYRVIQEGLTNARHHGRGAAVTVTTAFNDADLRVTVENLAPTASAGAVGAGGGHGLLVMRERVQHAGGSLLVGPTAGGGWRVDARFPVAGSERA